MLPPLTSENISIQPHLNLDGGSPSPNETNIDQMYCQSSTRSGCFWENKQNVKKKNNN